MQRQTRTVTSLLSAAVMVFVVSTASAQEVGIEVGKKAPAFDLPDQDGKQVKSADLLKRGPIALVFHRSANW